MEPRKLVNLSYEEAVLEKNKYISDIIMEDGQKRFVMITPNKKEDFLTFIEFVSRNFSLYTDELCKEYCSDSKYQVRSHLLSALHN